MIQAAASLFPPAELELGVRLEALHALEPAASPSPWAASWPAS
jgi:hypothetical protein